MFKKCLALAVLFLGPTFSGVPSGSCSPWWRTSAFAGGFISYYDAAYASNKPLGFGGFIDWSPYKNFGIEAEGRWLMLIRITTSGSTPTSPAHAMASAAARRSNPTSKVLMGGGVIDFPYGLAYGRYFVIAPGGGADFRLNRHWRIRADYEYQIWPDAPGIPGIPSSALKPNGVSVGFAYRFF